MSRSRPPRDATLGLLREGYGFISSTCDALGTDLFMSRALLRPVTFIRGVDAARIFYDGERFSRSGAMPTSILHLLQDEGSVQSLEGRAHHGRKQMFLQLMSSTATEDLGKVFEEEWEGAWMLRRPGQPFSLHDLARAVLSRTACRWAGIPLASVDMPRLTSDLSAMIEETGAIGPANWNARRRRRHTEAWAGDLVRKVREGAVTPPEGTALHEFALGSSESGQLLAPPTAAVELINILRPILAVARFIVFAQHALVHHPRWREEFAAGEAAGLEPFVQEVRRFYPFFPMVPGTVRRPFTWSGHRFATGDWVLLDIYGTNRDRRCWGDPEAFLPERFCDWTWEKDPYGAIPQGAGGHADTHRCPGEWGTVEIMKRAVRLLSEADPGLPAQDLTVRLDRIPALPRSGMILTRS